MDECTCNTRPAKKPRISAFFQLAPIEEAEARRRGLEQIIEKGLLWEILKYVEFGDVSGSYDLEAAT